MPFLFDDRTGNSLAITDNGEAKVLASFTDGILLDSFNRLRVSQASTLFDSQQEYGLDTLRTWDCTANGTLPTILSPNGSVSSVGNSVGPRDVNTKLTPITTSATNGHYSILQSRQYTRYIPGYGHLIFLTGVFATNASYEASIVLRTSTSGSPSDIRSIPQSQWNIDKFDGSGPSKYVLDLTKTQILVIGAQWLGVGRVLVGFDIDGCIHPAHEFLNANILSVPYTGTFNLPIRWQQQTLASQTKVDAGYFDSSGGVFLSTTNANAGGTSYFNCVSVQSEGASEARGYPQSQNPGIGSIAVTTRRPVFSIRPSSTFQGITNRAHIELDDFWVTASTNPSIYEIIVGGTLTGASWLPVGNTQVAGTLVTGIRYKIVSVGSTDFTLIGAASNTVGISFVATGAGSGTGIVTPENSVVEYDVSATAITGGGTIITGEVISGAGAARGIGTGGLDFRNPLVLSKIDNLAANQVPVTIVCTSVIGTSNIRAGLNWHEQVI
jgi:hypothetical protein